MTIRVGFIGFGEAGQSIGVGLAEQSNVEVVAYDPRYAASGTSRVGAAELAGSVKELAERSTIILSTVVPAIARKVAQDTAHHLSVRHTYVDLNSVSPASKQEIGESIAEAGAAFVEGAIMTNVLKERHRVPIFVCGPGAHHFTELATKQLGMAVEYLGNQLGQASATKMFRSIIVKGLEALFLECLSASGRYGVEDRVLDVIQRGYSTDDWRQMARSFVGRTRDHGIRRADEMIEVAATLREMGIQPFMAEAASKRIKAGAETLGRAKIDKDEDSLEKLAAILAGGH